MVREGLRNSESERPKSLITLDVGRRFLCRFRQREVGNARAVPAVHGFHADLAIGMVTLPEGDRCQKQVIFRAAMRAFEDRHGRTMRLFARQDQRFPLVRLWRP
jgi:hypothetical protein